MSRRSRPRRAERRVAANTRDLEQAEAGRRWARRVLVGCAIAWVAASGASAAAVALTGVDEYVWGVVGGRNGDGPVSFILERGGAVTVAVLLLAAPMALAALGLVVARDRITDGLRPDVTRGTVLSDVAAVGAVALAPNVVGCLWVSGLRPGSNLVLAPMIWPVVAAVFTPILWDARDLLPLRRRGGDLEEPAADGRR